MAGPWERYAAPASSEQETGPWAKYQQPAPDSAAPAAAAKPTGLSMTTDINGNPLPQRTVSFLKGVMDPVEAASQLITKALPDSANAAMTSATNWISDKTGGVLPRMPEGGIANEIQKREQAYEQSRAANGETGIDGYRALGNILSPVNVAAAARIPQVAGMTGRVALGAASGAASGALTPVASDDFWTDKAKQVGIGAGVGAAVPMVAGGISRLISPNASTNADLALLKAEGVNPTIGQTLGGWVNRAEEKLQSIPFFGDAIAGARNRSREDFNKAAINRTLAPIGDKADSVGHEGVRQAGDKLSAAYDNLLGSMTFRTDPTLVTDLSGILASKNLAAKESDKFNAIMQEHFSRLNSNGTMNGQDFKVLESTLSNQAKKFSGSTDGYQKELGEALADALESFRGALGRANPNQAPLLKQINEGWANLVRVEGAAKSGINAKGVFTPAQLNGAVRGADASVRDRATSRGEALMQDLGDAAQTVLGNRVPNSGTADRLFAGVGGLVGGAVNPVGTIAGLAGGALAYTAPVQRLLSGAVSARPAVAQPIADSVRRLSPAAAPLLAPAAVGVPADRERRGYANGGLLGDDDPERQPQPGIRPTPVSSGIAKVAADSVRAVSDFASKPFGYDNPPGKMIAGALGLPAIADTLENVAYGSRVTRGTGQATQMRPETAEAAASVLPVAPGAARLAGRAAAEGGEAMGKIAQVAYDNAGKVPAVRGPLANQSGKIGVDAAPQSASPYPQAEALETARQNAVKMLGLPENNGPMDRAKALGFNLDGFHGTVEDVKAFDPRRFGSATGAASAEQGVFIARNPDGLNVGGAETASQYARIGDRTSNQLTRDMAAAEKRGRWDKYEELTQQLEDYEIGKQQLASGSSEQRDKLLNGLGVMRDAYGLETPGISEMMRFQGLKGIDAYKESVLGELAAKTSGDDLVSKSNYMSKLIDTYKSAVVDGISAEVNSGGNVMPLMVRSSKVVSKDFGGVPYREESFNDVIGRGFKGGADTAIMKNTFDPGATSGPYATAPMVTDVVAVKDPARIRSRFAAFDPARVNENDLLGAADPKLLGIVAGASGIAAASPAAYEQYKKTRRPKGYANGGMIGAPEMTNAIRALAFGRSVRA